MGLRLESRALNEAIEATAQFFKTQRVVACCGDRLTLACLCLAETIRRAVVGAATTDEEGFEPVLRHKPSLLICSSDLETGYGMNLLRRVKAELPMVLQYSSCPSISRPPCPIISVMKIAQT